MAGLGQEDRFPPRRARDRFGFSERTFPETRGNDEVAPLAAIDVIWRSRHAVPLAFSAVLA